MSSPAPLTVLQAPSVATAAIRAAMASLRMEISFTGRKQQARMPSAQADDVLALARILARAAVEAHHRLVLDDHCLGGPEAVEAGLHRRAIGAEHADLD